MTKVSTWLRWKSSRKSQKGCCRTHQSGTLSGTKFTTSSAGRRLTRRKRLWSEARQSQMSLRYWTWARTTTCSSWVTRVMRATRRSTFLTTLAFQSMWRKKIGGARLGSSSILGKMTSTLTSWSTQVMKTCQSAKSPVVNSYWLSSSTMDWLVHIELTEPTSSKVLTSSRRNYNRL